MSKITPPGVLGGSSAFTSTPSSDQGLFISDAGTLKHFGLVQYAAFVNTAVAPNTVTSLAGGTATTTTIPLTWVESGGVPTTRTVTQRTPTGSGSYVASSGTFGSTGGTVTGLTANASYDFQVVESNTAGSSGTATLTNRSTLPLAPNTVTSLASGTITTTTIPLTWVESGGTPTTRTVTQRTPSGSGSYVASAGTFGSTGGTVTGLTSGVSYDFQVVESNTGGTSGTATLTNVSTTSAGGSGPNLTMTSATYATSKSGFTQALSGGSGVVASALTMAANSARSIEMWINIGTVAPGSTTNLISDQNGDGISIGSGSGNIYGHSGGSYFGASGVLDGAWHHIRLVWSPTGSAACNLWIDGVFTQQGPPACIANPLYTIGPAAGMLIDEVAIYNSALSTTLANFTPPTAPGTFTGSVIGLWHLDGNGTSA
jgi:hypothetical protein